jgi:hypothetical protein
MAMDKYVLAIHIVGVLVFVIASVLLFKKAFKMERKKYTGRKYEYDELYKLTPCDDITPKEIAIILNIFVNGGFSPDFILNIPSKTRKHFTKISLSEFDKIYNPDMENDK